MGKIFVIGFSVLIIGGVFMASLASGQDLKEENKAIVYFDNNRNSTIEIIFYKKVAHLSGKNFGNKIKLFNDSKGIYKNEKNNLILFQKDGEVLIFIGKKKIFEGKLQKDDLYKNTKLNSLTKTVWKWKNSITQDDAFLRPVNSNIFNLSFMPNGKVLAATNCADFSGTYELNGDKLSIVNLTQTKKFCDNLEGEVFIQSLEKTDSLDFDKNNNLVLFLNNNSGLMSFIRK